MTTDPEPTLHVDVDPDDPSRAIVTADRPASWGAPTRDDSTAVAALRMLATGTAITIGQPVAEAAVAELDDARGRAEDAEREVVRLSAQVAEVREIATNLLPVPDPSDIALFHLRTGEHAMASRVLCAIPTTQDGDTDATP